MEKYLKGDHVFFYFAIKPCVFEINGWDQYKWTQKNIWNHPSQKKISPTGCPKKVNLCQLTNYWDFKKETQFNIFLSPLILVPPFNLNNAGFYGKIEKNMISFVPLTDYKNVLIKMVLSIANCFKVVFNQKEIVAILSEHIQCGTVLSLQPTLELLAAAATDLQQEFCSDLEHLLNVLLSGPFKIRCV